MGLLPDYKANLARLSAMTRDHEPPPAQITPYPPEEDTQPPRPDTAILRPTPYVPTNPSTIPPRAFIYGRHFIRKFISATIAPGAVGKSSLEIAEALAISTGRDLLGIQPDERTNVWLWNGEDPYEELQRRIEAAILHYQIDPQEIAGRLFVDTGRQMKICIAEQTKNGAVIQRPVVQAIKEAIRENGIGLLSIDPFIASHRVTENDNNAIELVVAEWMEIADETGCAVDLVHHARKTGGNEVTVEDGRGAVALLAKARSARVLNTMSEDEAAKAGVENRRLHFRVGNGKANLSPASDKADWYKLASVDLCNGYQGAPGDSVGVVTEWTWPDALEDVTVNDLRAVQALVAQGRWRENHQAGEWVGKAVAQVLRLDPASKPHKAKIIRILKTWIANGMFVVVTAKDHKGEDRPFVEVGQWAND